MPRFSPLSVTATCALAMLTFAGCGAQEAQNASENPKDAPASVSESDQQSAQPTDQPSTSQKADSSEPQQTEHAQTSNAPTVSTSTAPPELTPLPATSGQANISSFKAEITDASLDKTKTQAGHELQGSPGIRVNLKLTNVTDKPADASILSFPTAELDGAQVSGTSDNSDPAKTVFGTIQPGQSQELSLIFATETQPQDITVKVQDPANPETSTALTHSVSK